MEKQGKFWGVTSPVFHKNNVEINRIEGQAGGYSSEHCHRAKFNMFFVEKGRLEVTAWKCESGKPDISVLKEGETCTVPPGYYHKFKVVENCVVYEIYWVELRPDDIERRTVGGCL